MTYVPLLQNVLFEKGVHRFMLGGRECAVAVGSDGHIKENSLSLISAEIDSLYHGSMSVDAVLIGLLNDKITKEFGVEV